MDGAGEQRQQVSWTRRLLPKRRPYQLLLVAGLAFLSTVIVLCIPEREPRYQGKPASYWFDSWGQWPQVSDAAFKAMGPRAVPFLLKVLEQKPSAIAIKLDEARSKYYQNHPGGLPLKLDKALPNPYQIQIRRQHAAYLLEKIGPPAAKAIPVLKRVALDPTEDEGVRAHALSAFWAMGEKLAPMVPEFIEYLKSDDGDTRNTGLLVLLATGPAAKPAVPLILKLIEQHKLHPSTAAWALWKIDRQTNIALRIFTDELQVTNAFRDVAIHYLREMGPAARPAAPQLVPFLQEYNERIRRGAELALHEIAPELVTANNQKLNRETDALVEKLIATIKTGDFREGTRAIEAVAVLGPLAKAAVPVLVENLGGFANSGLPQFAITTRMLTQRDIAQALAEIGPDASAAVPAIIALAGDPRSGQPLFLKTLGRIGPAAKDAVPLLEKNLRAQDAHLRLTAADALTRIVPGQCSNAVVVLRALQHDTELATVWVSSSQTSFMRSDQKDFNNPTSRFYRLSAAVPLWKLGLEEQSPAAALLKELEQSSAPEEFAYIELLGDLGPEAKAALPKLETYLAPDKEILLRRRAAIAIRKIDPAEANRLGLPGALAVPMM